MTIMATFANQASNVSALGSKFHHLLKVRNPGEESGGYLPSKEEKQRNAEAFFASQRNRVGKIEKELLTATGNILPPSRESKTITELAELCRLTQVATREKLEAIRLCLEKEGYAVTSARTRDLRRGNKLMNEVSTSSPSLDRQYSRVKTTATLSKGFRVNGGKKMLSDEGESSENLLPLVTNIGGPLESVLEAEYETDGTTPGSNLESPFFSSTPLGFTLGDQLKDRGTSVTPSASARKENPQRRRASSSFSLRSPGTPPTLDKLRISASTNMLLQHMENDRESKEGSFHDTSSRNDISFSKDTSNKLIVQDHQHYGKQDQQQQHLFEFRDEDDMITLDTTMTKNTTLCSPMVVGGAINEKRSSVEERSQFFARMEGILERVEETILEESQSPVSYNRSGDESLHSKEHNVPSLLFAHGGDGDQPGQYSDSNDRSSKRSDHSSSKAFYEGQSGTTPTGYDEYSETSFSKDSTNMVATQVAENEDMPFVVTGNNVRNHDAQNIIQRHPTQILVDSGAPSPAHTNITMDATFMSEMNGTSIRRNEESIDTGQRLWGVTNYGAEEEDDNLSTVTPVLDRYRLDPSDENSSGLKVVPNKRSARRSNKKRTPTLRQGQLPTIAQLSPTLDYIIHARTPKKDSNESDFMSPQVTTSQRHLQSINANTPSNQKRKVYRKTPFPKRKPDIMEDEDENLDPNIRAGFLIPGSPEPFDHDQESFSISVPPLRHSSFEPKRTDDASTLRLGGKETRSLSEKQKPSINSELPPVLFVNGVSRQTYLKEETDTIQKIDATIQRIDLELSSPARSYNIETAQPESKTKIQRSSKLFVDKVTELEFESAPRIVRTSVSRDRANEALHAIHAHCSDSMVQFHQFEFTEKEGCDIVGFSKQETKNILISLCHWRRLIMKRDKIRGMIFAGNNRKQETGNILS